MTERREEAGARARAVPLVMALVAAAAVAVPIWTTVGSLRGEAPAAASWTAWRQGGVHPAEAADRDLAPLRQAFPVGARVGWIVPLEMGEFMRREPDLQRFYAAQYALAPAVLKPVYLPECRERGGWACGLGRVDFVLLGAGGEAIVPVAAELGFAPASETGGLVVLARRTR
ncbi:MAG TPA: hypothetical protein VLS93_07220 [Anaeromyxobacteraceae bacterium]|nr:hypothetical protein [Anaeromyxobacteraceae bacterium]